VVRRNFSGILLVLGIKKVEKHALNFSVEWQDERMHKELGKEFKRVVVA
jgi:hypothetical protein